MRADKAKVVNEEWDDERIASFLNKAPLGHENPDFSKLVYAYRSMRVEDFARFIAVFVAAGGDVSTPGVDGRCLAEVITPHAKSAPFLEILNLEILKS